MIISDATLQDLLKSGELVIEPLSDKSLQPASVDLRLGGQYLKVRENNLAVIQLNKPIEYDKIEQDSIIIPPFSFLLATSMEYLKLPPNLTAFVEGRSSVGRMGLFVENAGWVDPGFEGELTLELYNANRQPIQLTSGVRICQLVFALTDKMPLKRYQGKYQGQRGPVGSRVYQDEETKSMPDTSSTP